MIGACGTHWINRMFNAHDAWMFPFLGSGLLEQIDVGGLVLAAVSKEWNHQPEAETSAALQGTEW